MAPAAASARIRSVADTVARRSTSVAPNFWPSASACGRICSASAEPSSATRIRLYMPRPPPVLRSGDLLEHLAGQAAIDARGQVVDRDDPDQLFVVVEDRQPPDALVCHPRRG